MIAPGTTASTASWRRDRGWGLDMTGGAGGAGPGHAAGKRDKIRRP